MSRTASIEHAAEKAGANVLSEAIDEVVGISSKRWALVLVAFLAAAALAGWIFARRRIGSDGPSRRQRSGADGGEHGGNSPSGVPTGA